MVPECGIAAYLDAKQQSFRLLLIGVHMQRVLTMQRVTGAFLEHGLTKKQAEGKLPLLPARSDASEPVGMLFHWTLLEWSSVRSAARMGVLINEEMWKWKLDAFPLCFLSCISQRAGDIPFEGGCTSSELSTVIGRGDVSDI